MVTRPSKCGIKKVRSKMEFVFSAFLLELLFSVAMTQSPCPGTFDYQNDGTGVIRLQPSGPASVINIRANFTISARLSSNYVGRIEPHDPEQGLQRYNQGVPLTYRVLFPVTSPLPRLTALVVNDQILCYGPADIPGPNQYVSSISLQHMLYLRGGSPNSVFYPHEHRPNVKPGGSFNRPADTFNAHGGTFNGPGGTFSEPGGQTQLFTFSEDGNGNYNIIETVQSNRPGQNFNIFYPERTTTQRPTQPPFVYYPNQPDFNPYTTQRPQRPPNYDLFTTQRPQQPPPDYNPYTTQRPQQPPPDYNPYDPNRNGQSQRPSIPSNPPRLPSSPDFSRVECGVVAGGNERQPLIHNGQSYDRGDWPWVVAIYKRKDGGLSFSCAGSLISDRHVVSAAHCMRLKNSYLSIRDIVVKVGVYNLEDWGDDLIVTRTLESATIHEAYNSSTLANDILVFTLDKSVEFSISVRPICLWDGKTDLNRIIGASGVVAGWGSTETGPGGRGEPRMARVPVVSTSACRASKPDFHKLTSDTTLCAGDRNGIGPCLGDSGGGLFILDSGRWRLRGIVSVSLRPDTGENTCDLSQYIVFTDAAKYLQWIRNIVKSSLI